MRLHLVEIYMRTERIKTFKNTPCSTYRRTCATYLVRSISCISILMLHIRISTVTGLISKKRRVPRYIDGSPVDLKSIPSYADLVSPSSYLTQKKRQLIRKNYADIQEVYSGITEEDKVFLTLYQSKEDKFSYLVGKKRKEATQQEKRQFAKQFLGAKQAECKSWFDNDVFELVDMRKL